MPRIDYGKVVEEEGEVPFYKETHDKILFFVNHSAPTEFWNIVRLVQGSDRRVLRLLKQMCAIGEISLKNKKLYPKKHISGMRVQACMSCQGKLVSIEGLFKNILAELEVIWMRRPSPTFLFDQRPVTLETTVRRAAYLAFRGDLQGKDVVLVGDDDLTSLALALTRLPRSVTVLDVDERLLSFIEAVSKEKKLDVRTKRCDLVKDFPVECLSSFDVFMADPTPSPEPFKLFISVGLRLLRQGGGRVGYVSFLPSHQSVSTDFQRIFSDFNVVITDMIPRFTEYAFIPETYRASDMSLLKEFDSPNSRLSFHENLTRFETTDKTARLPVSVDLHSMLGKATKRVLLKPELDPAYKRGEKDFVTLVASKLRREIRA